jgi:hypothetical protein
MDYKVSFLPTKGIVKIKNEGRLSFHKVRKYSVEATKLGHLNRCNKYLIDHSDTDLEHGIYKLHTDGGALQQFGFKNNDRIAIVISRKKDGHYFDERKAQEAKWCSKKYFSDINKAIAWLKG